MWPLSHSCAEGGQNAGAETWRAAQEAANEHCLLNTPDKLESFRDWLKTWGAWSDEEIAAMGNSDLNALFLQWVAGDTREAGADSLDEIDWSEYEKRAEKGECNSNLFRGTEGRIYFNLCY